MTATPRPAPLAPVSWGELLDKISILEIKADRIRDPGALVHVGRELSLLRAVAAPVMDEAGLAPLLADLRTVNERLWQIEDDIRLKEAQADFGHGFVTLARAVYLTNDKRSALKRQINALLHSDLVEQKQHPGASPA